MPWWQGTPTPSLAWIEQFLNFLRFFQAKTSVLCGRRDVIVGDVTSSLPAQQFQGGEEPPRQVWRASDISEFSTIFSSKIRHPVWPP
jgi:hypothetical protein